MILVSLLALILFLGGCLVYRRRRQAVARTSILLELGAPNGKSVIFSVIDLPHPPSAYGIIIKTDEVHFNLVPSRWAAHMYYLSTISMINKLLHYGIRLPLHLSINCTNFPTLQAILTQPLYATLHILK